MQFFFLRGLPRSPSSSLPPPIRRITTIDLGTLVTGSNISLLLCHLITDTQLRERLTQGGSVRSFESGNYSLMKLVNKSIARGLLISINSSACQFYLAHKVLMGVDVVLLSRATLAVADSRSFQVAKLTCSYCDIKS